MGTAKERELHASRLRQLRSRHGYSQEEMGKLLGVSREWIGKLEREQEDFSDYVLLKMEKVEQTANENRGELTAHEDPGEYRISGDLQTRTPVHSKPPLSRMVDPRFQSRDEPTPEMCKQYFAEYLQLAAAQPGGVGYVWVKLQKQFPIDEFREVPSKPPKT